MMKSISLLLITIFLISLIQNINAQSAINLLGNPISNLTSSASKYVNNTPAGQAGLIENNPGYVKYIPNTSSYSNNSAKTPMVASNVSTFNSKYVNNTPAGQAGLFENNPGYAKYIPNTSSYPNNSANSIENKIANSYGGNPNSTLGNSGHNNTTNTIGGALANTTKAVSNIVEKGISSITNLGNKTTR
jgi:hypothetical protein